MANDNEMKVRYLRIRMEKLTKIRQESGMLFDDLERELETNFRKVQNAAKTVDTIAFVATIAQGLISLSKRAFSTLGKTGKELASENKRFLSEFSKYQAEKTRGIIGFATETENVYFDFLLNFDSPSYWTRILSGVDPRKDYEKARGHLKRERQKALDGVDRRIRDTQDLLRLVERGVDLKRLA
jgi:hypothetical protein